MNTQNILIVNSSNSTYESKDINEQCKRKNGQYEKMRKFAAAVGVTDGRKTKKKLILFLYGLFRFSIYRVYSHLEITFCLSL